MSDNRRAAVKGAFVADALALGVHWVYNTGVIDKKFGRVAQYHDPITSYHKGKTAGDFTHYGDQMLVLLESVVTVGNFDAHHFADRWREFFADYSGYFDKATNATLEKMASGGDAIRSGSTSDDLAGASRLAALLPVFGGDADRLAQDARAQTAVTHDNDRVIDAADFFARCVGGVLDGRPPRDAIKTLLDGRFADSPIGEWIAAGLDSRGRETRDAIADFGQMCSVEAGLPGTVHLIARHGDDFKSALVENVMAGGDSSARGMLVGMVLGAAHGMTAIPDAWLDGLNAAERIDGLLAKTPAA